MTRRQKNHRANQKNPNNRSFKDAKDNRSNQKNPNNSEHPSRWSERMSELESRKDDGK